MDVIITYDINSLQTLSVFDGTEYTLPDTVASVNGVRLLFQTVNSVQDITNDITTCLAWTEYEVLTGTAIANGISYAAGSKMLFANDTTPTGTWTAQTTGRYGQYVSNTLPSSGNGWTFTPAQTGRQPVNTSFFADEVFTMTYEQYFDTYSAGETLAAGSYLCVGTAGQSVLIGGTKRVYVGEVYTSSGSETFTGAPILVKYEQQENFSFATLYESFNVYEAYLTAKAQAVSPSWQLDSNLLSVAALFASPIIAAQTTEGISLTQLQDNINQILEYYANQLGNV